MHISTKLKIPLLISYTLITLLIMFVVISETTTIDLTIKVVPTLILVFLYYLSSQKRQKLILIFFIVTFIADCISTQEQLFILATFTYGFSNVILALIIFKELKSKSVNLILKYLAFFIVLLAVILIFVIEDAGNYLVSIVFHGVAVCLALSVCLTNYLNTMIMANKIILIGVGFRVFSDLAYLIVISDQSNTLFYAISLGVYYLSKYLFYHGFILKEQEEIKIQIN